MAEQPSTANLAAVITKLTATVESQQVWFDTLEQRTTDASSSNNQQPDGDHRIDRPPRFQKMDFPRYDGKSDPLIFINRCESYFRQQRIAEEEKVWMASYNLEEGAQLWYIQV